MTLSVVHSNSDFVLSRTRPNHEFAVIERDTHDVPVLEVAGEVDLRVAPELGDWLSRQLASSTPPVVVLDLQAVTFLGVAGLSVLITAHRRARLQHTSLRIIANTATVCRSLDVAARYQPLEVYPKLTAATSV